MANKKNILILLIIFILQYGCKEKENKWTASNFEIKKRPSIHYSEMISGKLDSADKAEHELVKKINSDRKKSNQSIEKKIFLKFYNWITNK